MAYPLAYHSGRIITHRVGVRDVAASVAFAALVDIMAGKIFIREFLDRERGRLVGVVEGLALRLRDPFQMVTQDTGRNAEHDEPRTAAELIVPQNPGWHVLGQATGHEVAEVPANRSLRPVNLVQFLRIRYLRHCLGGLPGATQRGWLLHACSDQERRRRCRRLRRRRAALGCGARRSAKNGGLQ